MKLSVVDFIGQLLSEDELHHVLLSYLIGKKLIIHCPSQQTKSSSNKNISFDLDKLTWHLTSYTSHVALRSIRYAAVCKTQNKDHKEYLKFHKYNENSFKGNF